MSTKSESDEQYFLREISVDSLSSDAVISVWQKFVCDVGCVVWDSAIALAKYLDHNSSQLNLKRAKVVELGAGTGFCGIFCASLGSHVIITDLDYCLDLMHKNVEQNKQLTNDRVIVKQWDWSEASGQESQQFFDWSLNEINFVLVSDCIYYEQSIEHLYEAIVWLSSKRAIILLSYEERESKQHLINRFFGLISDNSKLVLEEVPSHQLHPEYQSSDLHLVKIYHKLQ